MNKTKIETFDSTWNPVTGCFHECEYCYARRIAERFGGPQKYANLFEEDCAVRGNNGKILAYPHSFSPTFHKYRLNDYKDKTGRNIFVGSMADLFGSWVPDAWIWEVFKACKEAPQHNYLFLTKNPAKYIRLQADGKLPCRNAANMLYGVSITNEMQFEKAVSHIGLLNPDTKTFASIEPILEDITFSASWDTWGLVFFDWVIIGAETGRRKGKVIPKKEWIENIVDECQRKGIPVFMKASLAEIWGEPLIQEFPEVLTR